MAAAHEHEEAQERHCQEWVDANQHQHTSKHEELEHPADPKAIAKDLVSVQASQKMGRERRDKPNIFLQLILDEFLDLEIRVDGSENTLVEAVPCLHGSADLAEATTQHPDGGDCQDSIERGERKKGLGLALGGLNLAVHSLAVFDNFSIGQSLECKEASGRNKVLVKGSHEAAVLGASKRHVVVLRAVIEHFGLYLRQATRHASAFGVGISALQDLVSKVGNAAGKRNGVHGLRIPLGVRHAIGKSRKHGIENVSGGRRFLGILSVCLLDMFFGRFIGVFLVLLLHVGLGGRRAFERAIGRGGDNEMKFRLLRNHNGSVHHVIESLREIKQHGRWCHWIEQEIHKGIRGRGRSRSPHDRTCMLHNGVMGRAENFHIPRTLLLNKVSSSHDQRTHRFVRMMMMMMVMAC